MQPLDPESIVKIVSLICLTIMVVGSAFARGRR